MQLITFLIVAPLAAAAAVFLIPEKQWRLRFAGVFASVMTLFTIGFCAVNFSVTGEGFWKWDPSWLIGGLGIAAMLGALAFSAWKRQWIPMALAAVQIGFLVRSLWTGFPVKTGQLFYVDRLALVLVFLSAAVGSLLCAAMQEEKLPRLARPFAYVLIAAVNGIALCDNLSALPGLIGIAGLFSCLLAASFGEEKKQRLGVRILTGSLIAAALIQLALPDLSVFYGTLSLQRLTALGNAGISVILPLSLMTAAGLILAAQMPFTGWMYQEGTVCTEAETLLKSLSLPAAGAFLILRLSPALGGTEAGLLASAGGAVTLFCASLFCAGRSGQGGFYAAGLGAVILMGGLGTVPTFWAGLLLLLLFGTASALMGCGGRFFGVGLAGFLLALVGLTLANGSVLEMLLHLGYLMPLFVLGGSAVLLWMGAARRWDLNLDGGRGNWIGAGAKKWIAVILVVFTAGLPIWSGVAASFASDQFPSDAGAGNSIGTGIVVLTLVLIVAEMVLWKMGQSLSRERKNALLADGVSAESVGRLEVVRFVNLAGAALMSAGFGMLLAMLWGGVL